MVRCHPPFASDILTAAQCCGKVAALDDPTHTGIAFGLYHTRSQNNSLITLLTLGGCSSHMHQDESSCHHGNRHMARGLHLIYGVRAEGVMLKDVPICPFGMIGMRRLASLRLRLPRVCSSVYEVTGHRATENFR